MKKNLTRCFILLFAGSIMVCCADKSAANNQSPEKAQSEQKPAETNKLPLGVEIPVLTFADDVKKYMRDVLAAPIPADYVLPEDVRNMPDYDHAVGKVGEHYPEFTGLENEALLRAVKQSPVRYQELIREAKSVREFYFPGSQPKASH